MDGLLQLASTMFLTFGLGTLLYALVSYGLKAMVGEEPRPAVRAPAPMTPVSPRMPVYHRQGPPHPGYAPMQQQGSSVPPGHPVYWAPPPPAPGRTA